MGVNYSKKENKNSNYIRIDYPFVCDFELKESYNYNRENYLKFFPKKKIRITQNIECNIYLCIDNIYIQDKISLDISKYKEKVDKKEIFYELEINKDKIIIFFRIGSKGLYIKEIVIKLF